MFDKLKNDEKWIFFSASLYSLIFLIFYPPFHTTLDENSFLRLAYLLRKGSIVILDPLYHWGFVFNGKSYVPLYPIGQSLLLLPSTLFKWDAVFLSGLFLHLLGVFVFYMTLKKLKFGTHNALLFLFFPYFVYYSTTLFSGFSSSLFILAAFYFYISEEPNKHFLSGIFFGIACLIRYTNLLAFIPFAFISLIKNRQRLKYLILGFAPFALFILFFNHTYYGGIFATGYHIAIVPGRTLTDTHLSNYLTHIPFISYRLLAIYPLMFFAPFFYKEEGRIEILLTILFFFLLYGSRTQSGWGFGLGPSTFTRYFLPIIPLYLVTYIPFYEKIVEKLHLQQKSIFILIITILVLGSIGILSVQHEYLSRQYSVSKEIYSNTKDHSLIVGDSGIRKYMLEPFGDRRFLFIILSDEMDISKYFDNNTYIVYKNRDGIPNTRMENFIKNYDSQLELIYNNHYESAYGMSRPFSLKIYYVNKLKDSSVIP